LSKASRSSIVALAMLEKLRSFGTNGFQRSLEQTNRGADTQWIKGLLPENPSLTTNQNTWHLLPDTLELPLYSAKIICPAVQY
jgi:hypothetical protein